MDARPGFHDASQLYPVGYCCEWRESPSQGGRVFLSTVLADELLQRPVFAVRLHGDGEGALVEGLSPETAWAAAQRMWGADWEDQGASGDHFGLALPEIARRLEGLPGVESGCPAYTLLEQSDWESEASVRARRAGGADEKRRGSRRQNAAGAEQQPRADEVAAERARVGAMSAPERASYLCQLAELSRPPARAQGAQGDADDKSERLRAKEAEKAARLAARTDASRARDSLKAAQGERAQAERESEARARARRARYPVEDSLLVGMEAKDAAQEGRPARTQPPRPQPTAQLPPYTGHLLSVCAFFQARAFVPAAELAPVLQGPGAASGCAVTPQSLRGALTAPDASPLLYEMYSTLVRLLLTRQAWEEVGGNAQAVAAAGQATASLLPVWTRTASRAGFAAFPELVRRYVTHGPRRYMHGQDVLDTVQALCDHGPAALSPEQHMGLLALLVDDVLECPRTRAALDALSEQRDEAKKAVREESRAARDAARASDEAVREARLRVDALSSGAGGDEGGESDDYAFLDDSDDEEYGAAAPGDKQKGKRVRATLPSARLALEEAEAAASAAHAELAMLEERHSKGLADASIRFSPLGCDAQHNRYWWSSAEQGVLYLETAADVACAPQTSSTWAAFTSLLQLEQLRASLNPNGIREGRLLEALARIQPKAQAAMAADAQAAAADVDVAAAAPAPAEVAYPDSFECGALSNAAKDLGHLVECVIAANSPPASPALREFAAALRQHRDCTRRVGGESCSREGAVAEVVEGLLAFEDELCRAHDPRAAGLTKAAARAAEVAARRAARAEEAAAAPATEEAAAAAEPPQPAEEDAPPLDLGPPLAMLDEAYSEFEEANSVETKPSGGVAKPQHPPLWRQARYRDAWRAAVQRCSGTAAVGPLCYAIATLCERSILMLTSLAPKEFRKRSAAAPPPRAPTRRAKQPAETADAGQEDEIDEEAVMAAITDGDEGEVPRFLVRDVLEELCRQHLGRDISRQKLAKHKIARMLPVEVLREAIAKAAADQRARGGGAAVEEEEGAGERKRKSGGAGARKSAGAARPASKRARRPAKAGEEDAVMEDAPAPELASGEEVVPGCIDNAPAGQ